MKPNQKQHMLAKIPVPWSSKPVEISFSLWAVVVLAASASVAAAMVFLV